MRGATAGFEGGSDRRMAGFGPKLGRRYVTTFLAVCGLAAIAAAAPTGGEAARSTRSSHPGQLKAIWGPLTLPDGSSAFPTYRKLGVQVLELQLSWADTAPSRPGDPTNPQDPAYQWPSWLGDAISD